MHIESSDYVDHPASEVYPLVRDRLPELLPFLPDVETIEQLTYDRRSDTRVHIVNRWRARSKIPSAAQRFVPADVLVWTDTADWEDEHFHVRYHLEGFGYEVTGINSFGPEGTGTRLKVTADVVIHPERFKVPKMLFNRVFPKIEGVVRSAVQPNLTALARGLRDYYAAQG